MLMANKSTIVRQAAAGAGPEDEKIKKFATAVVEFGKVTVKRKNQPNKQNTNQKKAINKHG